MASKKVSTKIGAQWFYPPHGVVTIAAIEEREFHGSREQFHVLDLGDRGTLLVPSRTLDGSTFRALINPEEAKRLLKRMKSKAKVKSKLDPPERIKAYTEQLESGDPGQYTEILYDLLHRPPGTKLNSQESKLLETARRYFTDELGAVLEESRTELAAALEVTPTQ